MIKAEIALWKALDKPKDREFGEFRATHKPSGVFLWVANGAWFLDICGEDDSISGAIGLIARHILWRKVVWCRAARYAYKLIASMEE